MSDIAQELDDEIRQLDPVTARTLETLVREAMALARARRLASEWPSGYFVETAGAFANEAFERPPQGTLPRRDLW